MKMLKSATSWLFIALIGLAISFTACSDDDDEDVSIVGAWTLGETSQTVTVNTIPFKTYLVDSVGMSQDSAQMMYDEMMEEMDFGDGTIEFKSDGSYTAKMGGEKEEMGSYTLSDDEKKITIVDDEAEKTELDVLSLSKNSLEVSMSNVQTDNDMNGDGVADTMDITVTMTFSK